MKKVENFSHDVQKITYAVTLIDGEVLEKTIKGVLRVKNYGYGRGVHIKRAEEYAPYIAGAWEAYQCDCGKIINSRHVKHVAPSKVEVHIEKSSKVTTWIKYFGWITTRITYHKR